MLGFARRGAQVLAAGLVAAAPAAAQDGATGPITLAEAEAMRPQEIAARFLPDEVDPRAARTAEASSGREVHLYQEGAVRRAPYLNAIQVELTPGAAPEDDRFCQRWRWSLTFTPVDPPQTIAELRPDLPVTLSEVSSRRHFAPRPEAGCASLPQDASMFGFGYGDEVDRGLDVAAYFRALIARAGEAGSLGVSLTCEDTARFDEFDHCADPRASLASLADIGLARVDANPPLTRFGGAGGLASHLCGRLGAAPVCYEMTFEPGGGQGAGTWFADLNLAADPPSLHLRRHQVIYH